MDGSDLGYWSCFWLLWLLRQNYQHVLVYWWLWWWVWQRRYCLS